MSGYDKGVVDGLVMAVEALGRSISRQSQSIRGDNNIQVYGDVRLGRAEGERKGGER